MRTYALRGGWRDENRLIHSVRAAPQADPRNAADAFEDPAEELPLQYDEYGGAELDIEALLEGLIGGGAEGANEREALARMGAGGITPNVRISFSQHGMGVSKHLTRTQCV
jgi:hypothetical protein